jgi:cobalt-zinc-cadmium efflux system outer membrane protein
VGKSSLSRPAALFAAFLSLAAPLPALAAELKYTMPQAVAFALANNGDLKAAREEKGIRDAGKVRSGLLPNPALDFEAASGALSGAKMKTVWP